MSLMKQIKVNWLQRYSSKLLFLLQNTIKPRKRPRHFNRLILIEKNFFFTFVKSLFYATFSA